MGKAAPRRDRRYAVGLRGIGRENRGCLFVPRPFHVASIIIKMGLCMWLDGRQWRLHIASHHHHDENVDRFQALTRSQHHPLFQSHPHLHWSCQPSPLFRPSTSITSLTVHTGRASASELCPIRYRCRHRCDRDVTPLLGQQETLPNKGEWGCRGMQFMPSPSPAPRKYASRVYRGIARPPFPSAGSELDRKPCRRVH